MIKKIAIPETVPYDMSGSNSASQQSSTIDLKRREQHVASSVSESSHSDRIPTSDVYASGGKERFYEPVPEYEGRHRWDPHAEWSEAEEKKLVRKVSMLLPPIMIY